jgi:tetratricopeptide (TPR) repeat protein
MHLVDSSGIPSREVLEDSRDFGNAKRLKKKHDNGIAAGSMQPEALQRLGNQLRVAGSLTQAMEAFRRASVVRPPNASLLFDYGRCMLSYAALERDASIGRRGIAMMRLAERRAGRDAGLLSLLGEAYVNAGDFRRAAVVFRNCSERVEATFRSVRWQSDLALREGKFAHVVHNFSVAHRLAKTSALKRWTREEVEYYTRLSADDEYMALEFSRLGLEDRFRRLTVSSLYLVAGGLAAILAGAVWDLGPVSDAGWAISGVAVLVWAGAKSGRSMFATRIPAEIVER